ncbi:nuclear autoantigenic sperm protein [Paragonimus westermani]|uniref:Nuclear autoantigenic sperm protein n=1 Tax=Paragonimus westermani TaxID=34504 RepID=A0A5J4NHS8_9TREM|nr:nuclear autoantigenic sperm protein [Paragonimus westermani]
MADEFLVQGRRNMVCGEIAQAVENFQKACELLSVEHGDLDDRLAEPNLLYGTALLELARMESTVLGNALDGVPEAEDESDTDSELVEEGPEMTTEEKEDISNQVLDAMCNESGSEDIVVEGIAEEVGAESIESEATPTEENVGESTEEEETSENEVKGGENGGLTEEVKEAEQDEDEDVTNLHLAWEVLEVAKRIFVRQNTDESRLKVAECLEKLAEISREKEDYTQAVLDLQECLSIRKALLPEDHRDIAETHYQLGATHAVSGALELASTAFKDAVLCLQHHVDRLNSDLVNIEKSDDGTKSDALRNSIKEIEAIIHDIDRRRTEVDEDRLADEFVAGPSVVRAVGAPHVTDGPAGDISHLIRKKRPGHDKIDAATKENGECTSPQNKKLKVAAFTDTADNHVNGSDKDRVNGTQDPSGVPQANHLPQHKRPGSVGSYFPDSDYSPITTFFCFTPQAFCIPSAPEL